MSDSNISKRATEIARDSAGEAAVWSVIANLWHPKDNPDGYVSLGVAENALMHEELCAFIEKTFKSIPTSLTYGDGPSGSKRLKNVLSGFLTERLKPALPFKPDHVQIMNGCTSAIEHCSWAIADPGEGILVGRPYYRAFVPDIEMRPGVKLVPVAFGGLDPFSLEAVEKYEDAIQESSKAGVKVRGLILCHPHNPLGRYYPKETIISLMRLCQKHQIHLISDEIYALSIWENTIDSMNPSSEPFVSASSIDITGIIDASLAHLIWGMSKDFGANGIRLGAIISQANPLFLDALRACSPYSSASSLTEHTTSEILSNAEFVDHYVKTNQQRLSKAHAYAVQKLREHDIEYAPGANSTFFLWVNLGKSYCDRHPEAKNEPGLTNVIQEKMMAKKVFLASGDATGAEQPGWFRLVFSQPPDLVDEGIRRIGEAIA